MIVAVKLLDIWHSDPDLGTGRGFQFLTANYAVVSLASIASLGRARGDREGLQHGRYTATD